MFNISSNKKDIEISEDEADSFKIDDIIIKNITNQVVSFKNKYWVRHEDSTENIDICPDKKEISFAYIFIKGLRSLIKYFIALNDQNV